MASRTYIIYNIEEIFKVVWSQVCETSADTIVTSLDGTKTFIKWEGEAPKFIQEMDSKEGPYSHAEMIAILNTPEWNEEPEVVKEGLLTRIGKWFGFLS